MLTDRTFVSARIVNFIVEDGLLTHFLRDHDLCLAHLFRVYIHRLHLWLRLIIEWLCALECSFVDALLLVRFDGDVAVD